MAFSQEWEEGYQPGGRLSVIGSMSDTLNYFRTDTFPGPQKVLDFGCGVGTNSLLFDSDGSSYLGIDGSPTIIAKAQELYPKSKFLVGDFTIPLDIDDDFDLVMDRGSVTHNTMEGIQSAMQNAWNALRPEGCYVGIDWFSSNHSEARRGDPLEDGWTRTNMPQGQFEGAGVARFMGMKDLQYVLQGWKLYFLRERTTRWIMMPEVHYIGEVFRERGEYQAAVWEFIVQKPDQEVL